MTMRPWQTILWHARKSLVVLAGAIALALVLILASLHYKNDLAHELAQLRTESNAQQAQLTARRQDLDVLTKHIEEYQALRKQGMLDTSNTSDTSDTAARENWTEQLLAAHRQLGLPETLSFSLPPATPITLTPAAAPAEPSASAPDETKTPSGVALVHDLEISLHEIHEEELLALLKEFQARINTRFRIQSCRLFAPSERGLTAQCTLRFFTLPAARVSAPSSGDTS